MRRVYLPAIVLLMAGVVILWSGRLTARAATRTDDANHVYLPYIAHAPLLGTCQALEHVTAWRLSVSVTWSDQEGPTTLDANGSGPKTYTASAQQTTTAESTAPLTDETIYDEATGNLPVGRAFRTLIVTGANSFVGDETVVTPPDGAGGLGSTVTTHWQGDGALTGDTSLAKVSIFGDTCKFNLDFNAGRVDLHRDDHIDRNVVTLLYLRQENLPADGIVAGSASIVPSLATATSPYTYALPQVLVMGYRMDITAWRQGGPLQAAQVTWRLEPVF
ncbi:hypothetical protein BH10CHL1_BH10CHL1_22530 [soil metagenome]